MATEGKGALKLVGGIFAPIGLVMLGVATWSGNRQYTILKTWPTVDAQVMKSQVTHHQDRDSQSETTTTLYEAEIEFRYKVNEKEYLRPSSTPYSSSSYTEMKRKADSYAPGTIHAIRYNPGDPTDIRFEVGYTFGFFLLPIIFGGMGLIFTPVGIGLLAASRGAPARVCPSCGQPAQKGQKFCPNCAAPLTSG